MTAPLLGCRAVAESWPLTEPVRIARGTYTAMDTVTVTLSDGGGHSGRGEAMGVPYDGETPATITADIARVAPALRADLDAAALQRLLPAGGARNALDCALWDLRAKQAGRGVWELLDLPAPAPLCTAYTLGLDDEAAYRRRLRAARHLPVLKLKVDRTHHLDLLHWAREEHPGARLLVDANQAWDRALLDRLAPAMAALGVELVEQPLPRGEDAALADYRGPVPLAADESCTDRASLDALRGLYRFVNVKLDKAGGLTEALATARHARALGFAVMVGNMGGTSLSMAPASLVAQGSAHADLDAPLLCRADRPAGLVYRGAWMSAPAPALWG